MSSQSDRPTDADDSDRNSATNELVSQTQEQRPRRRDSMMDSLSDPAVRSYLKFTIGIFGLIGLGFGSTGFLFIEQLSGQNVGTDVFAPGSANIFLLGLTFLIGPVIAVFSSLRIGEGLREDVYTIYLTSALGNSIGYFIMVLITVLFASATGLGSGTSTAVATTSEPIFQLGDLIVPMVTMAIPVALVGVGTAYLHQRVNTP